jgi:hypothetical protein
MKNVAITKQTRIPEPSKNALFFVNRALIKVVERSTDWVDVWDAWTEAEEEYRSALDTYIEDPKELDIRSEIEGRWFTLFYLKYKMKPEFKQEYTFLIPLKPDFENEGWQLSIRGLPLDEQHEEEFAAEITSFEKLAADRELLVEKLLDTDDPDTALLDALDEKTEAYQGQYEYLKDLWRRLTPAMRERFKDQIPDII